MPQVEREVSRLLRRAEVRAEKKTAGMCCRAPLLMAG